MADGFLIAGPGRFPVPAVGTSNYVPALLQVAGVDPAAEHLEAEIPVRIAAEPTNVHDPRAVRIADGDGGTLAYLPRADAEDYHDAVAALETRRGPLLVRARLGGSRRGEGWRIGVTLDLPGPRALSAL